MFLKNKGLLASMGILVIVAALLVSLVACGEDSSAADIPPAVEDEESIWGTAPEETLGVPVETPFATFHYPQEWEGKVTAERLEEEGRSVTGFYTELSGKNVELFSVILSRNEENGYLLGRLLLEDGEEIKVYTCMNELSNEPWTEEELMELSAMQERVNDIIAQFYENEAFQPEK